MSRLHVPERTARDSLPAAGPGGWDSAAYAKSIDCSGWRVYMLTQTGTAGSGSELLDDWPEEKAGAVAVVGIGPLANRVTTVFLQIHSGKHMEAT